MLPAKKKGLRLLIRGLHPPFGTPPSPSTLTRCAEPTGRGLVCPEGTSPPTRPTYVARLNQEIPGGKWRTTGVDLSVQSVTETLPAARPLPPTRPRYALGGSPPSAWCTHQRGSGHTPRSMPYPRGHSHRRGSRAPHNADTPTPPSPNESPLHIRKSDPSIPPYENSLSCFRPQKPWVTECPAAQMKKPRGSFCCLPRGEISEPAVKTLRAARHGADTGYAYYHCKASIEAWHRYTPFRTLFY